MRDRGCRRGETRNVASIAHVGACAKLTIVGFWLRLERCPATDRRIGTGAALAAGTLG